MRRLLEAVRKVTGSRKEKREWPGTSLIKLAGAFEGAHPICLSGMGCTLLGSIMSVGSFREHTITILVCSFHFWAYTRN